MPLSRLSAGLGRLHRGAEDGFGAFSAVETSVLRAVGALAILIPLWWWTEGGRTTFTAHDLKFLCLLGSGVLGNHLLTLFGLRLYRRFDRRGPHRRQSGHYGVALLAARPRYSFQDSRSRLRHLLRGGCPRVRHGRRCPYWGESLARRHPCLIGPGQLGVVFDRWSGSYGAAVSVDCQLDDVVGLSAAANSDPLDRSKAAAVRAAGVPFPAGWPCSISLYLRRRWANRPGCMGYKG